MSIRRVLAAVFLSFALAGEAAAATYRVGAGGTHSTIQAAVNSALAAGGDNLIKVAAGSRRERFTVGDTLAGRLVISGGWGPGFLSRSGETTVDGGGLAPVVNVLVRSGTLHLVGLRVTGGITPTLGTPTGGGFRVSLLETAMVQIEACTASGNRLTAPDAEGGGLWGNVDGAAHLKIVNSHFRNNAVVASTGSAIGGGASITVSGGRAEVLSTDFLDNEVRGPDFTEGAALEIHVQGEGFAQADDLTIFDNRTLSASANAWATLRLSTGSGSGRIVARRNQVRRNLVQRPNGHQVELRAGAGATITLTDSVVAEGDGTGILAWPSGGTTQLTNLTVARQRGQGLSVIGTSGTVYLSNSILFANGVNLSGAVVEAANRIGLDPLFVDLARGHYHLGLGSPAIDAGEDAPPGGLGPLDADRQPRLRGLHVDQGAYEALGSSGGSGGPGCRVLSGPVLFDPYTHVCRCLADRSLREFHCGFFLPDVFLGVRVPEGPLPGESLRADWTILPWTSVGGPYSLFADARIGGQWVPQTWLGPTAPELKLGQPVVEPFKLELPPGRETPLRTTLTYKGLGTQAPTQVSVEVVLPAFPKP